MGLNGRQTWDVFSYNWRRNPTFLISEAILTKTNTEVLCKENVFGDKIIWENIWKTIHSGLIDNWDLNIIYKLINQVIAVQ